MEVVIVDEAREGERLAADAIQALISLRPDALLGLATGSSPEPIYRELGQRPGQGAPDMSESLYSCSTSTWDCLLNTRRRIAG